MTLYLSSLSKVRSPALEAVNALLEPGDAAMRLDADHRLLWSAFAGNPAAKRDFLWRAEGRRGFLVLSARPPVASPFFDPPRTRPFAPDLRPGDTLNFTLRVNATKDRAREKRNRRADIVMDALHDVPAADRAAERMPRARMAAAEWMKGQGTRNGFAIEALTVEDYRVHTVPKMGRRAGGPRFGVLDLTGLLRVTEPSAFLDRIGRGFGRARAFGCGLMLIRRA